MFCFGNERRISLTTLADGTLTVIASLMLIRLLGPIGAPLGSLTGLCLISLPANLTAVARDSGVAMWSAVYGLRAWFSRFMIVLVGAGTAATLWTPSSVR